MPERVTVARPRRASLVLAHLLPLVVIVAVIEILDGPGLALQALPYFATLFGLVLLLNLWYWRWNVIEADEHGLIEVIRGRDRRKVAWDDILSASYEGGSYLWGMAGSISSGVDLNTTMETPPRLFQYDGELTIGRLQPSFPWERDAVEAEATEVLRRFLGSRVNGP
jgi:hypothetical protein